jgi:hypothetical protein
MDLATYLDGGVQAIEASHATEHEGGCTLFLHADEVEAALARL